jgi:hypothetical protein
MNENLLLALTVLREGFRAMAVVLAVVYIWRKRRALNMRDNPMLLVAFPVAFGYGWHFVEVLLGWLVLPAENISNVSSLVISFGTMTALYFSNVVENRARRRARQPVMAKRPP